MIGPTLPFSQELHAEKYRGEGESFKEAMNRIAGALQDNTNHFYAFRDALLEQRFLPAGRIQAAVGSTRTITPYNCYVSGTIEDSFVEGHGSIMGRATEAAATLRMGGGIGYDFSTLRPRGAVIKKLGSRSTGPVSFMEVYDAICRCVASSGHRRGAQMGILRIDHPDIEEFIHAKQNEHRLTGFNVSVAVTDEFMHHLEHGKPFPLRWNGQTYKEIDPRALWEMLMRSTWDWAEPGVLFIDRINQMNNLHYCETIAATNPCSEQPLPPHGACLLGSFNLVKYLDLLQCGTIRFDFSQFKRDIPHAVRAMDNVIDQALYPLYEQECEAKQKRRMGLGVTGLANAGEVLGYSYASTEFLQFTQEVMRILRDTAYRASADLAEEKGAFPRYERESYLVSGFAKTLPPHVRARIAEVGIRNSHLISVAPAGTISLTADNVSSGIEPVFQHSFKRTVFMDDGKRQEEVHDYAAKLWGVYGRTSEEVTADEHLAVLRLVTRYVDSAVSKTCNVPSSMPWTEFKDLYRHAWAQGCKGLATYQLGGRRTGIFADSGRVEDAGSCRIDPDTGRRECD
jgi:ribonucleoside-diphosphate reductase alpha chain